MGKIAAAQSYIDGADIAEMGIRFTDEFRHEYPLDVHGHMLAVGPMQAFIGLAIKQGRLHSAAEVAGLREQLATARAALQEIANDTEVHTKLNQERLCCKFQDIAARAIGVSP